jgi:hypothetical protein
MAMAGELPQGILTGVQPVEHALAAMRSFAFMGARDGPP